MRETTGAHDIRYNLTRKDMNDTKSPCVMLMLRHFCISLIAVLKLIISVPLFGFL